MRCSNIGVGGRGGLGGAGWREEHVEETGRLYAVWWLTETSPYMVAAEVMLPTGQVQPMTGVALPGEG